MLLAAGAVLGQSSSAATIVDWLELQVEGTPAGFTLIRDDGSAAATGALSVTAGVAFPGLPWNRELGGSYWSEDPGITNTRTGDSLVDAFEIRVAGLGDPASYVLEFSVPSGVPLVLAVGELYRDSGAATAGVEIAVESDSGSIPTEILKMVGWDNGLQLFNQDLEWDETSGTLSPAATAEGQSKIAFFNIAPIEGTNARVRLTVPDGFAPGTGDSLTIGLGEVIPEPAVLLLVSFGTILLFGRRQKRG